MQGLFWWVRQLLLTGMGAFFLVFGIQLLVAAYRLKDPAYFVMTFFASNLMILISGVLLVGFVLRMVRFFRPKTEDAGNEKDPPREGGPMP